MEYLPFGSYRVRQDLDGSFPNVNYTFTDQEDDDETGLYNCKARLYDPLLGRFISADSLVPEPGNLQAFNRDSYCVNNPLVYVDPSGHFAWVPFIAAVLIGAAAGASYAAVTNNDIATGALTGAVSAACFYAAGGIIGTYGLTSQALADVVARSAIHMAAGGVSGGINAAITGGDVAMGALVGGISAGVAKGLGGYIPGNLTGNSYVDFGIGLVEHAAIGGITGGVAAELYGGSFGEGFEQGAITAGFAYIFNLKMHEFLARYRPGSLVQCKGWAYDGKAWTQIDPNAPWPFEDGGNQLATFQERGWKFIDGFYNNPASEAYYGVPGDLRRPTAYFPTYGPIEKAYSFGRKLWNSTRDRAPGAPEK